MILLLKFIIFTKLPRRKKSWTAQDDLGKIIDAVGRELCFLSVYMENPNLAYHFDVNNNRADEGHT